MWIIQKSIVVAENRTIRFQRRFQGCNLARAAGWSAWPDRQLSFFLSQESWQRQFLSHSWPESSWTLWSKITYMGTGTKVELMSIYSSRVPNTGDWADIKIQWDTHIIHFKYENGQWSKELADGTNLNETYIDYSRISLSVEFSKCLLIWY